MIGTMAKSAKPSTITTMPSKARSGDKKMNSILKACMNQY